MSRWSVCGRQDDPNSFVTNSARTLLNMRRRINARQTSFFEDDLQLITQERALSPSVVVHSIPVNFSVTRNHHRILGCAIGSEGNKDKGGNHKSEEGCCLVARLPFNSKEESV